MSIENITPTIEVAEKPSSQEQQAFNEAKKELYKLNYETKENGVDFLHTPIQYKVLYYKYIKKLANNEQLRNELTNLVVKTRSLSRLELLTNEKGAVENATREPYELTVDKVAEAVTKDIQGNPMYEFRKFEGMLDSESTIEVYKKIAENLIETKNILMIQRLVTSIAKDYEYDKIFAEVLSTHDTNEIAELATLLKDKDFPFKLLNTLLHDVAEFNSEIDLTDPVFKDIWKYLVLQNLENSREIKHNPLNYLTIEERVDFIIENKETLLGLNRYDAVELRKEELFGSVKDVNFKTDIMDKKTQQLLAIISISNHLNKPPVSGFAQAVFQSSEPKEMRDIIEKLTSEQIDQIETEKCLLSLEAGKRLSDTKLNKLTEEINNPKNEELVAFGFLKSTFQDDFIILADTITDTIGEEKVFEYVKNFKAKADFYDDISKYNLDLDYIVEIGFFHPTATPAIEYLLNKDYSKAQEIKQLTNTPNKTMELNEEMFSKDCGYETYAVLDRILSGSLTTEDNAIGLTRSGEEGIQELKRVMKEFKGKLNNNDLEMLAKSGKLSKMISHDLLANQMRTNLRIDKSQYSTSVDELRVIVGDYEERVQNGTQVALPENYKTKHIKVKLLDQEEMANKTVSKDVAMQYNGEVELIQQLSTQYEQRGMLMVRSLIREMKGKVEMLKLEINNNLNRENIHPKQLESLTIQLEKLSGLESFRFEDYEVVLGEMMNFKELAPLAKKLLYIMTIASIGDAAHVIGQLETTASQAQIDTMIEFINHSVKQETWGGKIQDTKLQQKLFALTKIQSLEAESARLRKVGEAGTVEFALEPTKGLLMELSGSFSDACWAGIENTSGNHPNITTLVFRKNPENKHERIVGSCMLIETVATDGTPLTIIRGINPLENEAFQMVAGDFVDQIIGYVAAINKNNNKQTAIVIDDHQGGSASNRTSICAELKSRLPHLKQIDVNPDDTTFNGYNISKLKSVYLV